MLLTPPPRQPLSLLSENSMPLTPPSPLEQQSQRFGKPTNSHRLDDLCKPFVPTETKSNNSWATGVFKCWVVARNSNSHTTVETFPEDILEKKYPCSILDRELAAFVLEARRVDGNPYPGNTIKNILAALLTVMKENQGAVNIISFMELSTREKYYPQLNNALDWQLRTLRSNGIGIERKRADIMRLSM